MNREVIRSPIPDESLNTLPEEKQQLKRVLRTAFSCSVLYDPQSCENCMIPLIYAIFPIMVGTFRRSDAER